MSSVQINNKNGNKFFVPQQLTPNRIIILIYGWFQGTNKLQTSWQTENSFRYLSSLKKEDGYLF